MLTSELTTNISNNIPRTDVVKEEYGDWQTSLEFAKVVCAYL